MISLMQDIKLKVTNEQIRQYGGYWREGLWGVVKRVKYMVTEDMTGQWAHNAIYILYVSKELYT